MIKNIILYLVIFLSVFIFNIFFYAWFSWYLLVLTLCIPVFSLICSLPFMIINAVNGFSIITQEKLSLEDELCIGIKCRNDKGFFCPLVKINFRLSNNFAEQKKRLKFLYGGFLKDPAYIKSNAITQNCGCIEVNTKYCKIYDLLGIFFIPIKINYHSEILVMPKENEPLVLPDLDHIKIIGYKPKNSGFSDEYELRNYQRGDSPKSVHWKISARYSDLVVKEPSTPIYTPLIIKPVLTRNINENNITLGKFIYSANYLVKNELVFYCISPDNKICKICDEGDIKNFLLHLYKKLSIVQISLNTENAIIYTITYNREVLNG